MVKGISLILAAIISISPQVKSDTCWNITNKQVSPMVVNHFVAYEGYAKNVDPNLIIAIIEAESQFQSDATNGECIGLMQINPRWHKERMERLGCDDLYNPLQNIRVGVDILSEKIEDYGRVDWALMAYNGGNSYANRMIAEGKISTYAMNIIERSSYEQEEDC